MSLFIKSFFTVMRDLALALGVALLVPIILYYTVQVVHQEPVRSVYQLAKPQRLQELTESRSSLQEQIDVLRGYSDPASKKRLAGLLQECALMQPERDALQKTFDEKNAEKEAVYHQLSKDYAKIYLYSAGLFSALCLLVGACTLQLPLSVGCIVAGFICLTTGYVAYWDHLPNGGKLLLLILALALVVGLSYRFFMGRDE